MNLSSWLFFDPGLDSGANEDRLLLSSSSSPLASSLARVDGVAAVGWAEYLKSGPWKPMVLLRMKW